MPSKPRDFARVNSPLVAVPSWPAPDPAFNAYQQIGVDLPFPIISPFVMRSDLHKLDTVADSLTRLDCQYPVYARKRLELMAAGLGDFLALEFVSSEVEQSRLMAMLDAIAQVAVSKAAGIEFEKKADVYDIRFLAAGLRWQWNGDAAELSAIRPDAQELAAWLIRRSACSEATEQGSLRLACVLLSQAWALGMQEDFVLMAGQGSAAVAGQELMAESMLVSFPSGWSPEAKLGQSLSRIHRPVADGHALRRASSGLSQAMLAKGPFVRHVWSLCDSAHLSQHPRLGQHSAPVQNPGRDQSRSAPDVASAKVQVPYTNDLLSRIWFRCERQTTIPLAEHHRAMFLIRLYMAPLAQAADDEERRAVLVSALGSMSDEIIRYKNLGVIRQQILAAWG